MTPTPSAFQSYRRPSPRAALGAGLVSPPRRRRALRLVRETKPARIVEVGSGHSTRFMARAVRDGGLATEITAIDPAPRADIEGTRRDGHPADRAGRGARRRSRRCSSGDILFINSSHILMPGTDVDILFNHVLPALPRRRAGARARHLPARRLSAGVGMARLQRAARRRGAYPGPRLSAAVVEPLRGDAHAGGGGGKRRAHAAADGGRARGEPVDGEGVETAAPLRTRSAAATRAGRWRRGGRRRGRRRRAPISITGTIGTSSHG